MVYGTQFPVSDQVLDKEFVLPIGKAKIQRPGKHVTIVAHSRPVDFCLTAANELAGIGKYICNNKLPQMLINLFRRH